MASPEARSGGSTVDAPWTLSTALAVVAGLAWALCFGRESQPLLAPLALVPFFFTLGHRRAVLWGWAFGATFWLVSMEWLGQTLITYGGLNAGLARFLGLLLALYLGLEQALFAGLGARLWRRGGVWALVGLPSLWVALEQLRGLPIDRFPWNLSAYAWVDVPGALLTSAWIGAAGISWLACCVPLSLALAARERRWTETTLVVLLTTLLLVLGGRFGDRQGAKVNEGMLLTPEPAETMAVVQPDAPILPAAEAWVNYERLVEMSLAACSPPGRRLLIWPESAAFPHRYGVSERLHRDLAQLHSRGCGVLLGTVRFEGERYFNAGLIADAGGVLGNYSKRKLVPWGEYIPLKSVLPFVGYLARNAGEFTAGEDVGLMPWGEQSIGLAICYEVVFAGAVAEQVQAGATVLSTITNDAWYGDTAAPWQHFRAARFRAAENRRPLLRAALTGVSALVDARGQVVRQLGVGERGVLEGQIRGRRDFSPFSRFPWAVPWGSVLLAAFAIVRVRRS